MINKVSLSNVPEKITSNATAIETLPVKDSIELSNSFREESKKSKWLILNYIAADCNLETYQMRNVDDMEKVGSDSNTDIVVQIDRGPDPSQIDGGWTNARRYYVTKDQVKDKLGSQVLENLGPIDMSNPKTLTDFIVWGVNKYPAEHVALVFNDHGGGFTGAMADDTEGSFMNLPDLAKGISDAQKVTGKKLDIIGFDACLMAEAEVAHELKDSGKILLGSEENEGGPGWTYSSMLGARVISKTMEKINEMADKRVNVGPKEFAKIVVDVNRENSGDIPTFSAIDLEKMPEITSSLNKLAESIIESKNKKAIKEAVSNAENYGGGYVPYRDLRDIKDLCDKMIGSSSIKDEKLKENAALVIESMQKAVIANENDPDSHPNSNGLSVYIPTNVGESGPYYNYKSTLFAKETKWDEAIASLNLKSQETSPDRPVVWPDGSARK